MSHIRYNLIQDFDEKAKSHHQAQYFPFKPSYSDPNKIFSHKSDTTFYYFPFSCDNTRCLPHEQRLRRWVMGERRPSCQESWNLRPIRNYYNGLRPSYCQAEIGNEDLQPSYCQTEIGNKDLQPPKNSERLGVVPSYIGVEKPCYCVDQGPNSTFPSWHDQGTQYNGLGNYHRNGRWVGGIGFAADQV